MDYIKNLVINQIPLDKFSAMCFEANELAKKYGYESEYDLNFNAPDVVVKQFTKELKSILREFKYEKKS